MTAQTFTATATDSKTGLSASKTATFNVGTGPAPFPSVLKTSGQNLVDANNSVMPFLPGFCVPVYKVATPPFPMADYQKMYNKGARVVRIMVYWDQLQPDVTPAVNNPPIDTNWVQANLDVSIQRAITSGPGGTTGMYVWLGFYYGPKGIHAPLWVQTTSGPASCLGNYAANGQTATQYLANRYGNPSSPQYTPAVIGMGINEPTPDQTSTNNWLVTHFAQQAQMAAWMRTKAPSWILSIGCGYGSGGAYANATGSGHPGDINQTFTTPPKNPVPIVTGGAGISNFWLDHHNYAWETTKTATEPAWDGRDATGLASFTRQRQDMPTYPPAGVTEAQLATFNAAYLASHVEYCSPGYANCPLFIGEYGWDPTLNGTAGIAQNVSDKLTAWKNAGVCGFTQWDYATNQSNDAMAARPGVGKPGADPNDPDGWQLWTNTMFANF